MITMMAAVLWCAVIVVFNPLESTRYGVLLSNFVFTPAIATFILLCSKYDTIISRALSSSALMFIGEISYSVYLLGFTIITGVASSYTYRIYNRVNGMAYVNSIIKVFVIVTVTTFVAYGCFNLFEKPMRNRVRKVLTFRARKKTVGLEAIKPAYEAK
jgi:peptidoglycan/LPS O-acetylase OafA/YrhL